MPAASSTNEVTSTSLGHRDGGDQRHRDQPDGRQQRHPGRQHDVIDDDREQADRADRQEREGHAGIQRRRAERDLLGGRLEERRDAAEGGGHRDDTEQRGTAPEQDVSRRARPLPR